MAQKRSSPRGTADVEAAGVLIDNDELVERGKTALDEANER